VSLTLFAVALVPWATTLQSYLQALLSYQDRERWLLRFAASLLPPERSVPCRAA
jgi:hypothetical protein